MRKTVAFLSFVLCGQSFAQKNSKSGSAGQQFSYNIQKAWDALEEENNPDKAYDLVKKALVETPDDVNAIVLEVRLMRGRREYGDALSELNRALKVNKPKKSGVPMSTFQWWKGHIYSDMLDQSKAVDALRTAYGLARKDNKDNLQSISFDYAQALYISGDLDGADVIYNHMLAEDETDAGAMVGLARTMVDRG